MATSAQCGGPHGRLQPGTHGQWNVTQVHVGERLTSSALGDVQDTDAPR